MCARHAIKLVPRENATFFFTNFKDIKTTKQCATGNPVPVPVDPVDFFRSGSGPVPAKYRPDRPDLTSKFGCRI